MSKIYAFYDRIQNYSVNCMFFISVLFRKLITENKVFKFQKSLAFPHKYDLNYRNKLVHNNMF